MKKIIATTIALATILTLTACGNASTAEVQVEEPAPTTIIKEVESIDTTYKATAQAVAIEGNIVTFETNDGNLWDWELEDGEDYVYHHIYTVTFDSLGTSSIYDDEMITIK